MEKENTRSVGLDRSTSKYDALPLRKSLCGVDVFCMGNNILGGVVERPGSHVTHKNKTPKKDTVLTKGHCKINNKYN